MSDWVDLNEAAEILGGKATPAGLRAKLNRPGHGYTTRQVPGYRGALVWQIERKSLEQEDDYQEHIGQWERDQASGFYSGKPLAPATIDSHSRGLRYLWREAKETPSLKKLTPDFIRESLYKAKGFGTRQIIHAAALSFYRYLAYKRIKPESDLPLIKGFAPERPTHRRRPIVNNLEFKQLLEVNASKTKGRGSHAILLTKTLLMLYRYTGMRRNEAISLTIYDIDLVRGLITLPAEKTKTKISRKIGIHPELGAALNQYLGYRPEGKSREFLLNRHGSPLTPGHANRMIKTVGDLAGVSITPHGLRRSFITEALKKGWPIALVQKIVGHTDIKTTQTYDLSTDADAIDLLRQTNPV